MVIGITAVASLFGFVREVALAYRFGTTPAADAWGIAAIVVAISVDFLLIAGPIATAAIPLLAERRLGDDPARERRALTAFAIGLVGAGAVAAVLFAVAAEPLAALIAPGFSADQRALLVPLLRWAGAALMPVAATGALAVALASRRRFARPTLTGLSLHICVLAALVWLAPSMGVAAVGAGVFAGAVVALFLQFPALREPGLAWPPDWPMLSGLWTLAVPVVALFAIREATLVVERMFASALPAGQLATLYYAGKLEQLPLGLFGISVAVVAYPSLAELAVSGRVAELATAVARAVRLILLLAVPSAVGLAALARPIIRLVLQHGAFGAASGAATTPVLLGFAAGLVGQSLIPSLLRGYVSFKETREPTLILGAVLAVNVALDLLLIRFGARGLAAAFAVTMTLGAAGLAAGLQRRLRFFGELDLKGLLVPVGIGSALLAVAAAGTERALEAQLGTATLLAQAAATLPAVAAGATAYAAVLFVARVPEMGRLRTRSRRMEQ